MGTSDEFYNTMSRSKGMISDRKIAELIANDSTINEISTISHPSDSNLDLIVVTSSKKTCGDLIRNGIVLSDKKVAKVKALFVDPKAEHKMPSMDHRRGMMDRFPFPPQRVNQDEWEEEQFSRLNPEDKVRPNFDEESLFGMGNSQYNEFSRNDPIFHQDSFR